MHKLLSIFKKGAPRMAAALTATVAACGGGGSEVLGNPPTIANGALLTGQTLSFAYFQRCINPVLLAQLPALSGSGTNTCAGSGCHDSNTGTGGALRLFPVAGVLDVTDAANTADVIRASDMYKNFYSAQAATVIGSSAQSRLLSKPLLRNVLHGGGQIFASATDAPAVLMAYWINHPVPQGQDEFSVASYSMFTPNDPNTGTCNTQ
jgi:hypothetical protein